VPTPTTGRVVLQVEHLTTRLFTRRGIVRAVDDVSFTVSSGETLGLVGESGSGKTLTCLSIVRLLPRGAKITGGRVLFRGDDLLKKSEAEMRRYRGKRISMILQDPMTSLNPVLTVGEQVAEPIRLHQHLRGKAVQERVIRALSLLRIGAPELRLHNYPHQLSGGLRQRVVGAIALSCEPEVLIADEPTTALDVTVQAQYLALLREIQAEQGISILFVTHDLGIVASLCHRVAVMYAGRIVECAPVEALFDSPAHPYTQALLAAVPQVGRRERRLPSIPGQPPLLHALEPGCAFAPRCRYAEDRCRLEPPEVTITPEHTARCWRTADAVGVN
jgi:oligopeptide/dipeptide ABC transporter ATP-binding protein